MDNIKNWAIAILGIVCLGLLWSVQHKNDQINTIELSDMIYSKEVEIYMEYVDIAFDEVCDYVEEKYGEYLPDTLWEGDAYDDMMAARGILKLHKQ